MIPWLIGTLLTSAAHAQTVAIDIDSKAAAAVGLDPDALELEINQFLSDDLRLIDTDAYMRQMAAAAAFSTKGMGVDYATNPRGLVFGASIGFAASGLSPDLLRNIGETLPPQGYAAQVTVMGGLNLGILIKGEDSILDRIVVYGNAMVLRPPNNDFPIRGTLRNAGLHVQVKLINPVRLAVVEWGGVAVTGGVEQATYILSLEQNLPLEYDLDGIGLRWDGVGAYEMSANAVTVPLEVSTNVRVLFIGAFAGLGLDLASARANASAGISGNLFASVGDSKEQDLGQASVVLGTTGQAGPMVVRLFGGLQLDLPLIKLYGQVNLGTGNRLGAHTGIRLVL